MQNFFYEEYGKVGCFDTRSSSTKILINQKLIGKSFLCAKEGQTQSKTNGIKKTSLMRTNNKAIMRLVQNRTSKIWIVKKFIVEHNHRAITPSRLHLLMVNHEVRKAKNQLMKQFKGPNISTRKAMISIEHENESYNRIRWTKRDIKNQEGDVQQSWKGHDAQMLIDHNKWHKKYSLFYEFDTTKGRLNISHFRDVLLFNSTHNTNQYGLIFVAFVGLNHHVYLHRMCFHSK